MGNRYGNHCPLPSDKRSQMAKDAAATRRALHPTKDDIARGAKYLASLSPEQREAVRKYNEDKLTIGTILALGALLFIPLSFIVLFFR